MAARLLVTDLDDTVYDWAGFYIPAFNAMVSRLSELSGVGRDALIDAFRRVHRQHRTTEYAFAIEELDVLHEIDNGLSAGERLAKYDSAIHEFRKIRKQRLKLFPGVRESLLTLKAEGVQIVGISDSMQSYVSRRLRQLGIDQLFSAIYSPADHGVPASLDPRTVRRVDATEVAARAQLVALPEGIRKPDAKVLQTIMRAHDSEAAATVCVGDSLSRDVLMAKRCYVTDVWARYGANNVAAHYNDLLRITYWTEDDVAREEALRDELGMFAPARIIDSFSELVPLCLN